MALEIFQNPMLCNIKHEILTMIDDGLSLLALNQIFLTIFFLTLMHGHVFCKLNLSVSFEVVQSILWECFEMYITCYSIYHTKNDKT